MAVTMYLDEPLHGDIPDIAIDLYDRSLKNFAPSYLTALLNSKLMGRYDDKRATWNVGTNQISVDYTDGAREVLVDNGNNTYTVYGYSADGVLLEQVETTFDPIANKIYVDVKADGSLTGIVPFAEATLEEIGIMLKRHYAGIIDLAEFWNVGDQRPITYNTIEAVNGVLESHAAMTQMATIIGFNHDYLTGGGKAAVTIQLSNGIGSAGVMHTRITNVGGWRDCKRRAWCNNGFFDALNPQLQALIKAVDKTCSAGNKSSDLLVVSDKVFFLSESEYVGNDVTVGVVNEGDQYEYYKNPVNRKKKQSDMVTGYDNHWTRSPAKANGTQYAFIEADGDINSGDSTSEYRLLPTFCI